MDDIRDMIFAMPIDKVSGLDGFNKLLFCSCWDIPKDDMVMNFFKLHHLHANGFALVSMTNIVLLPKFSL